MQAMNLVADSPGAPNSAPEAKSMTEYNSTTRTPTTTTPDSVLMNTFLIRKKQYCVRFGDGQFEWQRLKSSDTRTKVSVENIIAIEPKVINPGVPEELSKLPSQQSQPDQSVVSCKDPEKPATLKQFTIFYAKRMENSSNPNKWRYSTQTFHNSDSHVCQLWIETIQQQINGK